MDLKKQSKETLNIFLLYVSSQLRVEKCKLESLKRSNYLVHGSILEMQKASVKELENQVHEIEMVMKSK